MIPPEPRPFEFREGDYHDVIRLANAALARTITAQQWQDAVDGRVRVAAVLPPEPVEF